MLEIKEKTINGKTEPIRSYSTMQIHIPISINPAGSTNYTQDNGFTIKPFKTLAKPTTALFKLVTNATSGSSGYAEVVKYFNGVRYTAVNVEDFRNNNSGVVSIPINTDTDTNVQIQSYAYHGYSGTGSVSTIFFYNDSVYLDKSNTTLTIRQDLDNNLTDPVADFDTWGTEFSSNNYTTITTLNSTYVELQDTLTSDRIEMIGKFEGIDVNCKALIPMADAKGYVNCNGHGSAETDTSIAVYNHTTATWVNFGIISHLEDRDNSYTTGYTTNIARGGRILTNTGTEDWSGGKISDYVSAGAMYVKISNTDLNDRRVYLYLNYLALLKINDQIWD